MSRLFPRRYRVALSDHAFATVPLSSWRGTTGAVENSPTRIADADQFDTVQQLGRWIKETERAGSSFDIVLSSHLARFAIAPWDATAVSQNDQETLARIALEPVTGGTTSDWQIRLGPQHFGYARLVCAVHRNILDNLKSTITSAGARLRSVTPLMQYAANSWLADAPSEHFVALCIEDKDVLAISFNDQNVGWVRQFSQPDGDAQALLRAIDRQHFLSGGEVDAPLVAIQFGTAIEFASWRSRLLKLEHVTSNGSKLSAVAGMASWSRI